MTATSKQLQLNECQSAAQNEIVNAIIALVTDVSHWEGTAFDLTKKLNSPLTPRALSQKINQSKNELKKCGVEVNHKRIRGRPIIILSSPLNPSCSVTKECPAIQTSREEGIAKLDGPVEEINFPFKWQYGRVHELSQNDKDELNQKYNNGRKVSFCDRRHCDLCNKLGITHRKISDGNMISLLCRECAISTCRKAIALKVKIGGDNFGDKNNLS